MTAKIGNLFSNTYAKKDGEMHPKQKSRQKLFSRIFCLKAKRMKKYQYIGKTR